MGEWATHGGAETTCWQRFSHHCTRRLNICARGPWVHACMDCIGPASLGQDAIVIALHTACVAGHADNTDVMQCANLYQFSKVQGHHDCSCSQSLNMCRYPYLLKVRIYTAPFD